MKLMECIEFEPSLKPQIDASTGPGLKSRNSRDARGPTWGEVDIGSQIAEPFIVLGLVSEKSP